MNYLVFLLIQSYSAKSRRVQVSSAGNVNAEAANSTPSKYVEVISNVRTDDVGTRRMHASASYICHEKG